MHFKDNLKNVWSISLFAPNKVWFGSLLYCDVGSMLPSVDKSLVKTRKVSDDKPDGSPVNVNDEENDEAEEIS